MKKTIIIKNPSEKEKEDSPLIRKQDIKGKGKKTLAKLYDHSVVFIVVILFIVAGSTCTLFLKMMNEMSVKVSTTPPVAFNKPISQAMFGAVGMCLCIFVPICGNLMRCLFCRSNKDVKNDDVDVNMETMDSGVINQTLGQKEEVKKNKLNPLVLLVPSLLDSCGSAFLTIGLMLTYASVYQMIRTLLVVFVFISSVIFLKKYVILKLPHKYLGVILIVSGSIIVGIGSVIFSTGQDTDAPNSLLGLICVIISQLMYTAKFILLEVILKKFSKMDHNLILFYEGMFGVFTLMIVLFVSYFIPGRDNGSFENFAALIVEVTVGNWREGVIILVFTVDVIMFASCAYFITKKVSAASFATFDVVRIVWIVQLIRGREVFNWMELGGFVVLAIGVLVYNEVGILLIPFYGKFVKRMKKK